MSRPFSIGEKFIFAAVAFGLLHHIDHVLRADHSGWPAKAEVTPFTFSLVAYPLFLAILLLRSRPWLRVAVTGLAFVGLQYAHIFVETPADQYGTWADGVSSFHESVGQPNLPGISSAPLGIIAATISILLSLSVIAALIAFVRDAMARVPAAKLG